MKNGSAGLKEFLAKEMSRAKRDKGVFSLVMVRLVGLKREGLMKRVDSLLRGSILREVDIVKRVSKRRFGIILPHTSRVRALVVCKRIKEALREGLGEGIFVHTGVATYPFEAMDPDGLVLRAREDLGRNG